MVQVQELLTAFSEPAAVVRGKPFWAWNGKLAEPELLRQIRIFSAMGFGGFFMHSRVGLQTPYLSETWFNQVRRCIEEAKQVGLEAWLYDEDRWPSGAAGGLVTKDPAYQAKHLRLTRHTHPERYDWPRDRAAFVYGANLEDEQLGWYKKLDQPADLQLLPPGAEVLEMAVETDPPNPWYNGFTYLDTLDPESVAKFIAVTHEAYKAQVGGQFGKIVPGIFTDEPNGGWAFRRGWESDSLVLPWTAKLPERFTSFFGYELTDRLPELFFERLDGGQAVTRYHYYRCRTVLFAESFCKQIGDWCEQNNLMLTGHVLEEQPVRNAVSVLGAAMQCYPYMQAPGIDILTQYKLEYISIKQCVSVARQCGRKWVLSELYGCTGWETTFETYKHSGDWQAALGITLRCPHLSWYTMAGEAKRDYPASIHFHSPWWRHYKFVEDYFARLNVVLSAGTPVCDLAVIHPIESFYLAYGPRGIDEPALRDLDASFETLVQTLLSEHLDFDLADEQLLVNFKAAVESGTDGPRLRIGQASYRAVLVPAVCRTLRESTLALLKQFSEAGGTVVFAEPVADRLEGAVSDAVRQFAAGKTITADATSLATALGSARRVSVRTSAGTEATSVLYQLRQLGDDWAFFFANTDRTKGTGPLLVKASLHLPRGGQIQLWDAVSGQITKLSGELTFRSAAFTIELPASGSALVVVAATPQTLSSSVTAKPVGEPVQLGNSSGWSILLDDDNVLLLDRADAEVRSEGKKKFTRAKTEILSVDRDLREYLGIPPRGGAMVQPWVAANEPAGPAAELTLTYRFSVKQIPAGPLKLALEQPDRWTIALNGRSIGMETINGWWVDPAIKTLPVDPALLVRGKNILTLQGQFDRTADLEIVYLLGPFGVATDGKSSSITRPVAKLTAGSWTDQGLPFYAGNITYRMEFDFAPQPGMRYMLEIPNFKGTAMALRLNGRELPLLAWPPYRLEVTDALVAGENALDLVILGSRRNAFGPLHLANERPLWVGPGQYLPNPEAPQDWQDVCRLVEYGLIESPIIRAEKIE